MKKLVIKLTLAMAIAFLCGASANALSIDAGITINGADFLQSFTVENDSDSVNITGITYSLGTPAAGIATWDSGDGDIGGGTASDHLSISRYFQTVSWGGLSLGPGESFSIAPYSLDIDLISTLSPLSVTGFIIDESGTSLANAYFGVEFDDGFGLRTVSLNQTGWSTSQYLRIAEGEPSSNDVPEPATLILIGVGFGCIALLGRKQILK